MTLASSNAFDLHIEVPRHKGDGRPKILLPDGSGNHEFYTRVTTFASSLDDTWNLTKWKMRQVAVGLAKNRDLLVSTEAHADDKRALDDICEQAMEAARSGEAATLGTALHKLCEQYDRGIPVDIADPTARADVAAYIAQRHRFDVLACEQFVVCDDFKVGGTFDRIIEMPDAHGVVRRYIADIKTGSLDYAMPTIAVQLAMYANGMLYDPRDGTRTAIDVDQHTAVVIHLPQGQARCELVWVNIRAGYTAAQLAQQVREWRKRRDLHVAVV